MPNMGKSIYHTKVYNETRKDWKNFPTRVKLTDTIIPYMQNKLGLLKYGDNNYIYGISTGARGAMLIAIYKIDLFRGIACLSGDYNQTTMKNDNLMKGYYGDYNIYKNRWTSEDNPYYNADKIECYVYMSHGKRDKVVNYLQTKEMGNRLLKLKSKDYVYLNLDENGEHDYSFWDRETKPILDFFDSHLKPK